MSELNRRHFIERSLAGAGTLALSGCASQNEKTETSGKTRSVSDRVELGRTGIMVSRLAMGTGMHGTNRSSDHTKLGQKKFTELMRRGFDNGLNFFDMADLYGSHPFMKKALDGIPRDQYVLMSKIWYRRNRVIDPSGGAKEEVTQYLKELGTDHLDICLLHCVADPKWPDKHKRICDELSELKEKGIVKAIGCSFHNFDALKVASENPWADFILARINNVGTKMDSTPEAVSAVLKTARANGKALLGMKIFGEGKLVKPEQKDASLNYVLGNNLVDAMTIGMLSPEELDDSMVRINKALQT